MYTMPLGRKIWVQSIDMNVLMSVFLAVLFFVLTPGVLLRLPMGGSKLMVAATHAVVFALIYHFTHKLVWRATLAL
jgi:hypothetical protein